MLRADAGTETAPSYSFRNDLSMGLYYDDVNRLGVAIAGTRVARIDEYGLTVSGNPPGADGTLVVSGGGTFTGRLWAGVDGGGTATNPDIAFTVDRTTGFFSPEGTVVGVATTGLERLRISDANVGVATTAPRSGVLANALSSTIPALDVSGQVYGRLPVYVVSDTTLDIATNFDSYANSYFYITNSSFDTITNPETTSTSSGGTFFQLKNSTSSYLNVTVASTVTIRSPVVIPPSNAITLVVSPSEADTFLLF
jgi:hypothetical protein